MSSNTHPTLAAQLLELEVMSDDRHVPDDPASREAQLEKLEMQAAMLLRAATRQGNAGSEQQNGEIEPTAKE
ncbi:hypothetical protein [Hoeflea sp. EC-HK425]|uniref:hypothetical protein n=1 Tax=Hoeflea sp. EC-HK425 TaxID=2038388 RepID=UPI0012572469|nr:hypothetical protein [Hoeflea sp. EC-HK425]VVT14635.1 hypothetical protein HOE425_331141 [Hoeflea sp. EC-HK425]